MPWTIQQTTIERSKINTFTLRKNLRWCHDLCQTSILLSFLVMSSVGNNWTSHWSTVSRWCYFFATKPNHSSSKGIFQLKIYLFQVFLYFLKAKKCLQFTSYRMAVQVPQSNYRLVTLQVGIFPSLLTLAISTHFCQWVKWVNLKKSLQRRKLVFLCIQPTKLFCYEIRLLLK